MKKRIWLCGILFLSLAAAGQEKTKPAKLPAMTPEARLQLRDAQLKILQARVSVAEMRAQADQMEKQLNTEIYPAWNQLVDAKVKEAGLDPAVYTVWLTPTADDMHFTEKEKK
jgi:hypothetical protein